MRQSAPGSPARPVALVEHVALVVLALVPQLLSRPGLADADTKTYLYLDPGEYLRQSLSMWDPTVGLGTVTHQQIGYLFPMGPFFLATHALGIPTWVAQRLWVAAILLAAGTGVWWLARLVGVEGPGRLVGAVAYMLSPYTLQYLGHISVILLAFAALPWVILLVDRAARFGTWRPIAALALVIAAMGSVNATSAIYVGVGPLLWLLCGRANGRFGWPDLWRVAWRTVVLGGLVSSWWVAGLLVEGGYGIDVLRYTETVQAVSTTSLSSEVVRGLGYWYFYGGDNFGPWVSAMPQFTQELWLLGVGYVVPILAVASAVVVRWRHRAVFVSLALVGTVLAVGAHPFDDPSPVGRVLRAILSSRTGGLALRSTDRATPLVVLALAVLVGAGVSASWRRAPRTGLALAGVAAGAAVLSNPALWNGTSVPSSFVEPHVSAYEHEAAEALNHGGTGVVLGLPGQPFASYFSGTTVDPLWPGLLTRPFVTREQQVMGSLPTEDLLYGLDDPVQTGVEDPAALAPLARLMGVGDLLLQNDLAFTRYDQPDPAVLWSELSSGAPGLGRPQDFGPTRPAQNRSKVVDEQTYTIPSATPAVPSLAVLPVLDPRPLVRAEAGRAPLVVDGDGVGLDDIAGTGLLNGNPTVVYAGTLDTDDAARRAALRPGATLVVTDTNRRQPFRWDNIQDVAGPTLAAGQPQPDDPSDEPLDIFPGAPADAQTTTAVSGVASVTASASANPFQYLPEERPVEAVDGDPETAWQVGPFLDPRGQWWQVHLVAPVRTDAVTVLQPQTGTRNQWITEVTLRFDGRSPVEFELGPASRSGSGQRIDFPARTFQTLRITIDDTNVPPRRELAGGLSSVGLAEVSLDAHGAPARAEESVVMPEDLLRMAGASSLQDRLALVMTRLRVAPATSRTDPEPALDRTFWLPTTRTFWLTGTARLDASVSDQLIDELVGRPGSDGSGVVATSTGRLQGDPGATASAALDGNPATAWSSPIGPGRQVGQSLTIQLPSPVTFDHLDLQLVVDGRHSVPSRLRVATQSGSETVSIPKLPRQPAANGTDAEQVSFPTLSGRTVVVTILAIRPLRAADSYTGGRDTLPVAIAELGIPGVQVPPPPSSIPSPCRDDLLSVDGSPVWVEVHGTSEAALSDAALSVSLCGPDVGGLTLGPGSHHLVATLGSTTGLDLDQLVLDSSPGGGPESADTAGAVVPPPTPPAPAVQVESRHTTSMQVRITAPEGSSSTGPFWLVLGESLNRGWHASLDGRSLGPPQLVDGFANGWLVPASALRAGQSVSVTLEWTPQRLVDVALVVSGAAGALCAAIIAWPRRRTRRRRQARSEDDRGVARLVVVPGDTVTVDVLDTRAPGLQWGRSVAVAVGAGLIALLVTGPVAAAAVAAGLVVATRLRLGRLVVAGSAVGAMVATAAAMVVIEGVKGYPGNGQWPSYFEVAALLTWLALVLVVAEGFLRWARRPGRRAGAAGADARPPGRSASPPPSPPS